MNSLVCVIQAKLINLPDDEETVSHCIQNVIDLFVLFRESSLIVSISDQRVLHNHIHPTIDSIFSDISICAPGSLRP